MSYRACVRPARDGAQRPPVLDPPEQRSARAGPGRRGTVLRSEGRTPEGIGMNAPLPARANPLFDPQNALAPRWSSAESMPVVSAYGPNDRAVAQVVGIGDASARRRTGFKGPAAAAWLQQQSVPIPAQPNQWTPLAAGGLVARLGRTEYLIEDAGGEAVCARLDALPIPPGLYPVLRQAPALVLTG